MHGPDHLASLNPEDLHRMINAIRNIEVALGDGLKLPTKVELENRENNSKVTCCLTANQSEKIYQRKCYHQAARQWNSS